MKFKKSIIAITLITFFILIIYLFLCLGAYFYPVKYLDSIKTYSNMFGVKQELIASVINAESRFNPNAVSNKGAVGLMQLMPKTAKWICEKIGEDYSEEKLYEPDYNIKLGTYYLAYLTNKFDDLSLVICAFNAGEGTVSLWLHDKQISPSGEKLNTIPYKETKDYLSKVNNGIRVYSKKLKTTK